MREISLNILDVAQNSVSAKASLIKILVSESRAENTLTVIISDNGKGMTKEQLSNVTNPFFTSRTTRKVGMGIPLFKMAAEQTGGSFNIESQEGKGTRVTAVFRTDSIDFTPLGDMASTIVSLVTMNENINFLYTHKVDNREFTFSTKEIKNILDNVPLSDLGVSKWIREYLEEQRDNLFENEKGK